MRRLYHHLTGSNTQQMRDVVGGKRSRASLVEGTPMGREANSQSPNTCVLIWTEGDADMTFSLSFPPTTASGSTNFEAGRDKYVTHPVFSSRLGAGTLLVFTPEDDLFFCHEAYFSKEGQSQDHRMAFVFRWLDLPSPPHAMFIPMRCSYVLRVAPQSSSWVTAGNTPPHMLRTAATACCAQRPFVGSASSQPLRAGGKLRQLCQSRLRA